MLKSDSPFNRLIVLQTHAPVMFISDRNLVPYITLFPARGGARRKNDGNERRYRDCSIAIFDLARERFYTLQNEIPIT